MEHEFNRVAIVNRGEAAMRFIHAAREFNLEHDASLRTIALFTEPDRRSMFVREADECVCIGPALVPDPNTNQLKSSYLDYSKLEHALVAAHADAVWVGWGFVAEHAAFADLCRDLGIAFIGPDGDIMRRIGDKIASKRLAEQAQVPVSPWSGGPVETLSAALVHAERLGYPLLIKATAGGGGRGIRKVSTAGDLPEVFERARSEAFKAFGDPTVFMEHMIRGARHIEVQIIADHYGTVWAVGVRDCSIQRRHQKILEEAPSPALSPEQDLALRKLAVRLARAAGYRNAGTVEFLYEPRTQKFSFMEVNTRLQVEHPVTECTTGVDLVKLQIHVAQGGRLEGEPPRTVGHAIEVRLNAEDPDNHFAPAPGMIERFRIVTGPGIRVDTGVSQGDAIPVDFDSMIAKIIAYGRSRSEALSRLHRVLRESVVVVKGGASNKAFLLDLLDRDEARRGEADVEWLDRLTAHPRHVLRSFADVALVQAAIEAYDAQCAIEQAQFYASAARGRPQVRNQASRTVELRYCGCSYSLKTRQVGLQRYRVELDGSTADADIEQCGNFEYWLTVFGRRFHLISVVHGLSDLIEVDGVAHHIDREDGGIVHAAAPAVVVSIAVKPGDRVSAGDRLAVLEAMKMEVSVVAPFDGKVRQVMTMPNVQVDGGAPLVQIEPEAAKSAGALDRIVFGVSSGERTARESDDSHETLEDLRRLMLGFDVDARVKPNSVQEMLSNEQFSKLDEITRDEDEILSIFVDISALFQHEPHAGYKGEEPSSETHLFSYLRMLDMAGEGLPEDFVAALRRALAHYGVESLHRSPQLEKALLWICKSHQRVDEQIASVLALLECRLQSVALFAAGANESFRVLLDRIVAVTHEQFPAVSDLAREVRYRCFDQRLFEQACKRVYEEVEENLTYLAENCNAPDRRERLNALIECPQPLVRVLSARFASATPDFRELLLEAITRRYYRIRTLENFRVFTVDDFPFVSAEYDHEGRKLHVFTTHTDYSRLSDAAHAVLPLLAVVPADHDILIDFYAWHSQSRDPDGTQNEIHALLNDIRFPRSIRRIVVEIAAPVEVQGAGGMQHFTYRCGANDYEEETLLRGIHPMMAARLHLWRLSNFDIERLPSVEDVYVLHAVSRENPKDERLIACAEVRDVTPIRDEHGRVIQLPHLERMLTEALASIRLFQSRRPANRRLYWNRILLYVWQPLNLNRDELEALVRRLAPQAEGLGLEQVAVRVRIPSPTTGELRDMIVRISSPAGRGILITYRPAGTLQPIRPLTEYDQKVVRMRQRGFIYPYEIIRMLTPEREYTRADFPTGDFVEHDLDVHGRLAPVDRPHGQNKANIIAGVIRNFTAKHPEGMSRVILLGDPSKDLGALAEAECRRIIAGLDLAQEMGVPLEWFPISAGAKISMTSGVENMDWIAQVLRRLVEFTQAGGEVNLLINGINVGAQPYWNAEATMLMHTRGILVMTPKAAMVLTGKRALDYSGSISAEDNQGIGGYDRIMGLNGQAQYWARDMEEACHILFRHYEHTYVAPGERFPRRARTSDPADRDVRSYPHGKNGDEGFAFVGDILSNETNPGHKKSFDIRKVMMAAIDQDHAPLERWVGMRAAETAVVWDAHLGGNPVCLIGIESQPVPRFGFVPADGPDQWCAGTLFPQSSKKVARAINAASNNRPVVVLANLSGFDGSPESMRRLQLEYGAEIGRAVVNFKGPMVFCVISRYHGGAYVVFSRTLNEGLEIAALEGTHASVIGGAPAAAVVFAGEVEDRTHKDARLQSLAAAIARAEGVEKGRLRSQWNELFKIVHSEKLGEMASEFDAVHCVERALKVGALHRIIPSADLRAYLIDAVERGIAREEQAIAVTRDARMIQHAGIANPSVDAPDADNATHSAQCEGARR